MILPDRIQGKIAGASRWFSVLAVLVPSLFLFGFFYYPISAILLQALDWSLGGPAGTAWMGWGRIAQVTGFTAGQAALSTLLTFMLGLPAAMAFSNYRFPGRALLLSISTLPFIMPTVVAAAGFNTLIGPRGWLNLALMSLMDLGEPPIQLLNTLPAILLAHVFYNTTVVIRVVGSAWAGLDKRIIQAGMVLGASRTRNFLEVTLPLLRPALVAAALLVFLFNFSSFGVILLLGGPRYATLEVEIYTQALHRLNIPMASILSMIQIGFTLLLMVGFRRFKGYSISPFSSRAIGIGLRRPRSWREKLFVLATLIVLVIMLVSPLLALSVRSFTRLEAGRGERGEVVTGWTLDHYRELFNNSRQSIFYVPPAMAVRNSLVYAFITMLIALPLGWLAAAGSHHRHKYSGLLDTLIMLPIGTSAVTLGLGYILVFRQAPLDLRTFPFLIPIAHSLVALPIVVRTLQPAIAAIPPSLRQTASILGASPLRVWREVDLALLWRPVTACAIFSFTISMGEFGASSFLVRPEMPTIPVAIFRFLSQPGALNYGQALAMSTILLMVCLLCVLLLDRLDTNQAS